jgi:hypothetical protein
VQTDCPFSSRIAAGRWWPQREHGTAVALATQREQFQSPSTRLNRRTTFWQPGQAGATILAAPAAVSTATRTAADSAAGRTW